MIKQEIVYGLLLAFGFLLFLVILLNLIKAKIRNLFLSYFIFIVLYETIRALFINRTSYNNIFLFLDLFFRAIYAGPILYLYWLSVFKLKFKYHHIIKHLWFPFTFLVIKLIYTQFLSDSSGNLIMYINAILSFLYILVYLIKGHLYLKKQKNEENKTLKIKYRFFFYVSVLYFILLNFSVLIVVLLVAVFEYSYPELFQYIFFTIYGLLCVSLFLYGITEPVWIKPFFIVNPVEKTEEMFDNQYLTFEFIKNDILTNERYLDSKFNVTKYEDIIGFKKEIILQVVVNNGFKNFTALLNHFKVEDFKQKIINPEYENYTLDGLAIDCGFNSKSTFFRVFKEFEGITPSEYKERF
tara:strand:- start:3896 stop:4957 length:1062 start_codon:yes stop_codon:yes gene_type:complete